MTQFSTFTRAFAVAFATVALAACGGGGGGGGSSSTPVGPPNGASVSGDMLAYQANRGWNYQGTAFGGQAVTLSVYADPPAGTGNTFVLFGRMGPWANAFGGTKVAAAQFQNSGGAYNAAQFALYDGNGSMYAAGSLPSPPPTLVPSTLTQGATFSSYPGLTAVVQAVGAVPGASACPSPGTGATVAYTFQGQNYTVSYVPGCGITQYTGNNHEVITLVSVATYQLGTQSTRRMDSLTLFDTIKSAARVLANRAKWQPFPFARP